MEHYLPYLQWIEHSQKHMKELVLSWANINTHFLNYEGLEKQTEELKREFQLLGAHIEEVDLPPYTTVDDHGNKKSHPLAKAFVATIRPESPARILLSGHMDTVFKKNGSFQVATETTHETISGPGVSDMKGGLVVMLYALKALEKSPYKDGIGWTVVVTPDEEIGSTSSKPLLEKLAKQSSLGLVFEPATSTGAMVFARSASVNIVLSIRGKSAHAGRDFFEGKSALITACKLTQELDALNDSDVIVNIGELHSGSGFNIVSDLAILRLNIRTKLANKLEEVLQKMNALVEKYAIQENIWIDKHIQSHRPAMPNNAASDKLLQYIQKCGKDLGMNIPLIETFGASDANILAQSGLVTVDTLGPIGANLHTHKEYIVTNSLVDRAKLSALVLMQIGNKELAIEEQTRVIQL